MTVMTAQQAADICGVTLRTIQRRRHRLEAGGAWKDAGGKWHIPISALTAAGLQPGRPKPPDSRTDISYDTTTPVTDSDVATLESRLQVADLLRRAEVAEERVRGLEALVEAQSGMLKQLEATATRSVTDIYDRPATEVKPGQSVPPGPLRRWGKRLGF
ncbi:MAG: helix-turn-helix domain-containing protein [Actinomycetia bacterium]|nr:helix-turn-helix domain-containing protein [Actinomycetes bacterium]